MSEIKYCIFCGAPTRTMHHLIFGTSARKLATEDNLVIPVCDNCHNMAIKPDKRIHNNSIAEKLSKMLGQSTYEKKLILAGHSEEEARQMFRERYGKSWL